MKADSKKSFPKEMARKLIDFDPETLRALELLSKDSGKSIQKLADACECAG